VIARRDPTLAVRHLGRGISIALLAATALGCNLTLTNDDLLMCNAARFLTASIEGTEAALAIDAAGQPGQAAERAAQALGLAEGAARTLQDVQPEEQAGATWQALIRAYKHAADGASSLLPDFRELRGTGDESVQAARGALDGARLELPLSCFEVPPA
jgi:hypothetical protein